MKSKRAGLRRGCERWQSFQVWRERKQSKCMVLSSVKSRLHWRLRCIGYSYGLDLYHHQRSDQTHETSKLHCVLCCCVTANLNLLIAQACS